MNRGRADARLERTNNTEGATDAFTAKKLPPGQRPSTEWERTGLRRTAPSVEVQRDTAAGSAGAEGSGEASWRRRLAPHHREVVRRFFDTERKTGK